MNLTAVLNLGSSGVRIFFVIWLGQLVSLIGTRLTAFALGYWVYQQTGSATQFMMIAVVTALPGILMLPLTGTFVDRMDRRLVLMLSDAGAGLCTLRSCFKIIRIGFSMRYVPYKVPICGGNQNSQTRITPGFGDVA
ncbi:hypothetical protein C2W62_37635, partial [Candidatus Entotheonella serta]